MCVCVWAVQILSTGAQEHLRPRDLFIPFTVKTLLKKTLLWRVKQTKTLPSRKGARNNSTTLSCWTHDSYCCSFGCFCWCTSNVDSSFLLRVGALHTCKLQNWCSSVAASAQDTASLVGHAVVWCLGQEWVVGRNPISKRLWQTILLCLVFSSSKVGVNSWSYKQSAWCTSRSSLWVSPPTRAPAAATGRQIRGQKPQESIHLLDWSLAVSQGGSGTTDGMLLATPLVPQRFSFRHISAARAMACYGYTPYITQQSQKVRDKWPKRHIGGLNLPCCTAQRQKLLQIWQYISISSKPS